MFKTPLDRHFGWIGLLALLAAVVMAGVALALGLNGWTVARLWLWGVVSAMTFIVGLQLVIGWFIMRALEELSQRDARVAGDLTGKPAIESPAEFFPSPVRRQERGPGGEVGLGSEVRL